MEKFIPSYPFCACKNVNNLIDQRKIICVKYINKIIK